MENLSVDSAFIAAITAALIVFRTKVAIAAFLAFAASEYLGAHWQQPEILNYQFFLAQSLICLIPCLFGSTTYRCLFFAQSVVMFLSAIDSFLYQFHGITTLIYGIHYHTIVALNILILGEIIGGSDGGNTNLWRVISDYLSRWSHYQHSKNRA